MKAKERITKALQGQEIDRIPWSPFLAYFWEYQSQSFQKKGQLCFLEEIGADPIFRGTGIPGIFHYSGCDVSQREKEGERLTTFTTPVGELTMTHRLSHRSWFITKHPVKTVEELKTLQWMQEHLRIDDNTSEIDNQIDSLGDRALVIPRLGLEEGKTAFQALLEKWIGTEELVYMVMDHPKELDSTLEVMRENSSQVAKLAAQSKGEYFLSWEDTSTTNINPSYFSSYILPEINQWCDILHGSDKKYIQHACGHLKDLLPLIGESKIDGIESVSPPPTGNIEFNDFRDGLPDHMALIGGIEPVFFENCTHPELEGEVKNLIDHNRGRRVVLGNSDSCPPGVTREKMELVSRIVRS